MVNVTNDTLLNFSSILQWCTFAINITEILIHISLQHLACYHHPHKFQHHSDYMACTKWVTHKSTDGKISPKMLATKAVCKCASASGRIKKHHHYHQALLHSMKSTIIKNYGSSSPLIAIPASCERNPTDYSKFKYGGRYFGYSGIHGCIQHVFLRMQNCVSSYAKRVSPSWQKTCHLHFK